MNPVRSTICTCILDLTSARVGPTVVDPGCLWHGVEIGDHVPTWLWPTEESH
ncbi:hypothetical protein [Arthrobacter sp. TB 23]|jgi:hypothetical protein|uniref:hypothetical protein n=1 Tax=Arthrobacter sp. TB 23 TaxID=494419 RepID=UPI00030388E8|nr:hypothetical protein [Arthrobacter sp. TB 23]